MKTWFACAVLLSGCFNDVVFARGSAGLGFFDAGSPPSDAGFDGGAATPMSGFATLWANDPLRQKYSFVLAEYGTVLHDNQVTNRDSHLDFGAYEKNAFTVGIQGGEQGVIADLGTDDALAARLGVSQTIGGGQGFAALTLAQGQFNDAVAQGVLTAPPDGIVSVPVVNGHVYALRVVDRHDPEFELLVKLLVVDFTPDTSVTFEWVRL